MESKGRSADQSKRTTILCDAHQGPVLFEVVQRCPDCQQGFADATARANSELRERDFVEWRVVNEQHPEATTAWTEDQSQVLRQANRIRVDYPDATFYVERRVVSLGKPERMGL